MTQLNIPGLVPPDAPPLRRNRMARRAALGGRDPGAKPMRAMRSALRAMGLPTSLPMTRATVAAAIAWRRNRGVRTRQIEKMLHACSIAHVRGGFADPTARAAARAIYERAA